MVVGCDWMLLNCCWVLFVVVQVVWCCWVWVSVVKCHWVLLGFLAVGCCGC